MKNYSHHVIRIRKGKPSKSHVYRFIQILNKRHQKSQKVKNSIGYYRFGKYPIISINCKVLADLLNTGVILNKSVKRYLFLSSKF